MMMKTRHGLAIATMLCSGVLVAACERGEAVGTERKTPGTLPNRGTTETPVPARPEAMVPGKPIMDARKSLVQARCAMEQRCNNIGASKPYATRDNCMNEIAKDWEKVLDDCSHGVSSAALDNCMQAMNTNACDHKMKSLSDVAACKEKQLCQPNE